MCTNVYELIHPLHVLSKLLGFNVFSFRAGSRKTSFTKCDALFAFFNTAYTILLNLTLLGSLYIRKICLFGDHQELPPCRRLCELCYFHVRKSLELQQAAQVRRVHDFDEELTAKFKVCMDFKVQRRFVLKLMLALSLSQFGLACVTYSTTWYYQMDVHLNVFLFTSYGFIANCILINLFIASVSGIKNRFRAIHRVVR
jgi:hypothetical protein